MTDKIFTFLEPYFGKKAAWFGEKAPIIADSICLDPQTNYRADSGFHGKYSVIWIYEYNLFENESWPLLLNEAISLLCKDGVIICRMSENKNGSIFALKSYLHRNPSIEVDLLQQHKTIQGDKVCVFKVARKQKRKVDNKSWSFGILTNGKKEENVRQLIEKASTLSKDLNIEFIIAGQFDKSSLMTNIDITIFDLDVSDQLPRISQKKYEIGKLAKYDNVAIFHDRYQIGEDFFDGFDKFGYDFDFITVSQHYEDGSFFPGYAGFDLPVFKWMTPHYSKNYGKLFAGHYINGGVMIFKRSTLQKLSFNPLLLHNEAEDVELSLFFMSNGIVPRINVFSSATTVGVPNTYTKTFINIDTSKKTRYKKSLKRNFTRIIKKVQSKGFIKVISITIKKVLSTCKTHNLIRHFLYRTWCKIRQPIRK